LVTEANYFELEGRWEYDQGVLEKPFEPDTTHQELLQFFTDEWCAYRKTAGSGRNLPNGTKIRLWPEKYRDPDLTFYLEETYNRVRDENYMTSPDWVLEVSSKRKRDRDRDFITKKAEYAKAGIPEYWIVDPKLKRIHVYVLEGRKYHETVYAPGEVAVSVRVPGFNINVTELFKFARLDI
jgi:Uma2 family endonuclease